MASASRVCPVFVCLQDTCAYAQDTCAFWVGPQDTCACVVCLEDTCACAIEVPRVLCKCPQGRIACS